MGVQKLCGQNFGLFFYKSLLICRLSILLHKDMSNKHLLVFFMIGVYPIIFTSKSIRLLKVDLNLYGCTDGVRTMNEILLDRIERNFPVKSIKIHKRMDIFKNGHRLFRLGAFTIYLFPHF